MPTERRTDDIVEFAEVLLREYKPGTALYDAVDRSRELAGDEELVDTAFTIEVDASGSDLRGLLATLDAIQLAVDAATAAVFYENEFSGRERPETVSSVFLRNLVNEVNVTLEIVELSDGSFKTKVKAVFKHPVTRAVAIAVGTVSLVALSVAFPHVALLAIAAGAFEPVVGIAVAIWDTRADHLREVRIEALEGQLVQANEANAEQFRALTAEIQRLTVEVSRLSEGPPKKVDSQAIEEAHLQSVEVRLAA